MPGDLREDLAAAMLSAEEGAGDAAESGGDTQAAGDAAGDPGTFDAATGQEVTGADETPAQRADRERDAAGRFAPKKAEQAPADQQPPQTTALKAPAPGAAPAAGAPTAPAIKAPVSWTPEARETWAQMRPEHQQEVARRELEISQTLTRTAEVRRFAEDFERVVNPFMGFIAAENSTPLQAVQHLMQTAAILRIGTPQQKVKAAADIINQYGIDLEMLDSALAGVAPPPGAQPNDDVVQRAVQQAIAPFATQMQRVQQMQTQQVTQEAEAELQAFQANPANEFYADVANDMADLMELAQRRGVILSLQDAYSRATLAHPSISKVLEGRKRSQGVAQQTAAAQRAKAAAASVSSDIAPSRNDDQDADVDDLRATLRASVAAVAQRK